MSWSSSNGKVTMTKGDTPSFKIAPMILSENGEAILYKPDENDKIIFAMRKNKTTQAALVKEIPTDTLILTFLEEDTKNLPLGIYDYEVSLNCGDFHCTFIEGKKLILVDEIY